MAFSPIGQSKGYAQTGASTTKRALKGFDARSGSPNEDINYNNHNLRQRSRILAMSGGLALSAIRTNCTNVIGCGLQPKSKIDAKVLGFSQDEAKAWQDNTEREFAIWAENPKACDARGMLDYYSIQHLIMLSALTSGDCVTLFKRYEPTDMMPYSLRLDVVEADRISTPQLGPTLAYSMSITDGKTKDGYPIYDGVETDHSGLVQAYHICNNYPWEITPVGSQWERVLAYGTETGLPNLIHYLEVERPGQYRGVPLLAPVIEYLLQIRRYTESELMAAVIESFFTAFIKTEAKPDENPYNAPNGEGQEPVSSNENDYELGPGAINILKTGESVDFANPTRPANGFSAFIKTMALLLGSSLEITAEVLLKEFNSSYSASRAALMEAWKAFKRRREWFTGRFCRPSYEVWMSEAVALERIYAPGFFDDPIIRAAYLGSDWVGPSQGMLDPVKEITAEILSCENGFSTHADSAIKLNGSQWDSNIEQLKTENEQLSRANITKAVVSEIVKGTAQESFTEQKDVTNELEKQKQSMQQGY